MSRRRGEGQEFGARAGESSWAPSVLLQELPYCGGGDAGGEARAVGHTRDLLFRIIDDADGVRGLGVDYARELAGAAQEDGGTAVPATGVGWSGAVWAELRMGEKPKVARVD